MHGRLDSIHRVKRVLPKLLRELHEVSDGVRHTVRKPRLRREGARPADLELVVVETDDVHVGKRRNLARGAADATTDIENAHAGLEVHLEGEVVFMPRQGLVERLALVVPREVERRAPTVLVETRRAIIIACGDVRQHITSKLIQTRGEKSLPPPLCARGVEPKYVTMLKRDKIVPLADTSRLDAWNGGNFKSLTFPERETDTAALRSPQCTPFQRFPILP